MSKVKIVGVVDMPEMNYLGVGDECAIADMSDSMGRTLPAAYQLATDNCLELVDVPGAIYHRFDMKQQRCEYTAIVQTAKKAVVDGARSGTIHAGKALKIRHTGSYHHLGNAWTISTS